MKKETEQSVRKRRSLMSRLILLGTEQPVPSFMKGGARTECGTLNYLCPSYK